LRSALLPGGNIEEVLLMESVCPSLHLSSTPFITSVFKKCTVFSRVIFSIVLYFVLSAANSSAGQVQLTWDPSPSPDVTGYMVYYGTTSGAYSESIDVGNTMTYIVYNLIDGQIYYFAATAYNADRNQSEYSNEVSSTIGNTQYLLLISKAGAGTGSVSGAGINCGTNCLGAYNPGTVLNLTATADPGSTFAGWSGGGCIGTGQCTTMMNATTTIMATFQINTTGTLSVTTTPVSGGITVDGAFKANGSWSGSVAAGSHTISFGAVSGYNTPANRTVTVNNGQTTTVTGTYRRRHR
jgi:hypothetical protein